MTGNELVDLVEKASDFLDSLCAGMSNEEQLAFWEELDSITLERVQDLDLILRRREPL